MSRVKDADVLFNTYINCFLKKYAIDSVLTEAAENNEDDEEQEASDDSAKSPSLSPRKILFSQEPLSREETIEEFKEKDFNENILKKLLSKNKFSFTKLLQIYRDLASGKLSIAEGRHKKEEGGYGVWFSPGDFMRYIQLKLPILESLYEKITELTKDSANTKEVIEIKNQVTEIIDKIKIDSILLENIAEDTVKFLEAEAIKKEPVYSDSWISTADIENYKKNVINYYTLYKNNINKLVHHNMRLVSRIAAHMRDTYEEAGFIFDDRVEALTDFEGEGARGLIDAIHKFDYTRENSFSTAAWKVILNAVRRSHFKQSGLSNIPFDTIVEISKVKKARNALYEQLGTEPTAEQIATFLRVNRQGETKKPFTPTAAKVNELLGIELSKISMYAPVGGEDHVEEFGSKMRDPDAVIAGKETDQALLFKKKLDTIKSKIPSDILSAMDNYFNISDYNIERFKIQILSVRRQLQSMKQQKLNDSFDNEVNKFLSLYYEFTTTNPVNAITNVGKQAMVFDPSKMTGKSDCPVSRAAYEYYNMTAGIKQHKDWSALSNDERNQAIGRIKEQLEKSNKLSTNPTTTRPAASPNQQTQPSSKITAIGAI